MNLNAPVNHFKILSIKIKNSLSSRMDLQTKMKELIDQEFEEVEDEPYVMFEMGRKFSKRLGYRQAVTSFQEKFHQGEPLWYVQQDVEFFNQKLGENITKEKILIQANEIIESSVEDSVGTNILVRKHITKKTNSKKKVFVYSQNQINQIDLDPHTYAHNSN